MVYPVPRGGWALAALCDGIRIVEEPEQADVILDDLIDSGETMKRYAMKYPTIPFLALIDKRNPDDDCHGKWVVFPWEHQEEDSGPTDAVIRLLQFIGEDPNRAGLVDTPGRVLRAWEEMTAGYKLDPQAILSRRFPSKYDEMIISSPIRFTSTCEHHMLPFIGHAAVGYVPNGPTKSLPNTKGEVVGLSKLARLVHCFARRLQIQEKLTEQIADAIAEALKPRGVAVMIKAHHSCMGCRGVNDSESKMITSKMTGCFMEKDAARAEFIALADL